MITSPEQIAVKELKATKNVNRLKGYMEIEGRLLTKQEQLEFNANMAILEQCKKERTALNKAVKLDITKKSESIKSAK